jgi:hypothetical protein
VQAYFNVPNPSDATVPIGLRCSRKRGSVASVESEVPFKCVKFEVTVAKTEFVGPGKKENMPLSILKGSGRARRACRGELTVTWAQDISTLRVYHRTESENLSILYDSPPGPCDESDNENDEDSSWIDEWDDAWEQSEIDESVSMGTEAASSPAWHGFDDSDEDEDAL